MRDLTTRKCVLDTKQSQVMIGLHRHQVTIFTDINDIFYVFENTLLEKEHKKCWHGNAKSTFLKKKLFQNLKPAQYRLWSASRQNLFVKNRNMLPTNNKPQSLFRLSDIWGQRVNNIISFAKIMYINIRCVHSWDTNEGSFKSSLFLMIIKMMVKDVLCIIVKAKLVVCM